jgi:hypothetical protein
MEYRPTNFENRMLRIFGQKRDEATELHNSYSSLSLITVIKIRRIRWAGHPACIDR